MAERNNRDKMVGKTREQILERLGIEDSGQEVVLREGSGWSGGCETCEYWSEDMWIEIDGLSAYRFYDGGSVSVFLEFLNGSDDMGYKVGGN